MSTARGGRGGAEPPARILERRARAWELSVAEHSQREIARELGISQAAVSKILKRVGQEKVAAWRLQREVHVARTLDQISRVHREAMDAWARSQTDQVRRRSQRIEGQRGIATLTEAVATPRVGDPRYLSIALHAISQVAAILGPTPTPTPEENQAATDEFLKTLTTEEVALLIRLQRAKFIPPRTL